MPGSDSQIIKSPLCRKFTSDGITVSVEIFRLEKSEGWSLELVDEEWNSIVWDDLFPTDQAALDVFLLGVKEIGLAKLLDPDDQEPRSGTIH